MNNTPMVKLSSHHQIIALYFYLNEMHRIPAIKQLESDEKIILCDLCDDLKTVLRTGGSLFYLLGEELELVHQVLEQESATIAQLQNGESLLWIATTIRHQMGI